MFFLKKMKSIAIFLLLMVSPVFGNTEAGGLILSEKAVNMILEYETGGKSYYISRLTRPTHPGGASGVTIGIGYDLGYYTASQIKSDWAELPARYVDLLCSVSGLKGSSAKVSVKKVNSVVVPWELALNVYKKKTLPTYSSMTKKAFPKVEASHPHVQGAMVSLVYNRGASMSGDSRKEMRYCRDNFSAGQIYKVPKNIRSMKRLWEGKNMRGLILRRETEACLVEEGLK